MLLGETGVTKDQVNFEQIARDVCKDVGFVSEESGLDCHNMQVIQNIHAQAKEIFSGVFENDNNEDDPGAGDQGLMFGYATDEWDTESLHPYSHFLANSLGEELAR